MSGYEELTLPVLVTTELLLMMQNLVDTDRCLVPDSPGPSVLCFGFEVKMKTVIKTKRRDTKDFFVSERRNLIVINLVTGRRHVGSRVVPCEFSAHETLRD